MTSNIWSRWLTAAWKRLPYDEKTKFKMRRCSPDGASTRPATVFACGYSRICPWCHMRRVAGEIYWAAQFAIGEIDLLEGAIQPNSMHLVRLSYTTYAGNPIHHPAALARAIENQVYLPYLDALRRSGGKVLGKIKNWRFVHDRARVPGINFGELIMVRGPFPQTHSHARVIKTIDLCFENGNGGRIDRNKAIRRMIASFCAYPPSLLSLSNRNRTCDWLSSMRQRPIIHMFKCDGIFRNLGQRKRRLSVTRGN